MIFTAISVTMECLVLKLKLAGPNLNYPSYIVNSKHYKYQGTDIAVAYVAELNNLIQNW